MNIVGEYTQEQEAEITKLIAEQCNFELKERHAGCKVCGKRLMYHTYGRGPLTERMQNHAQRHVRRWAEWFHVIKVPV